MYEVIIPSKDKYIIGQTTLVKSNTASNAKHSLLHYKLPQFFFLSDKKFSQHRTLVSSCLYQDISANCKDMLRFPNALHDRHRANKKVKKGTHSSFRL
jgi:hypothetical protein